MAKKSINSDEHAVPEPENNIVSTEVQAQEPVVTHRPTQIGPAKQVGVQVYGQDVFDSAEELEEAFKSFQQIDKATQENIGFGEIQISRIVIAQPGTPEIAGGVEGYMAGQLLDNLTRDVISEYDKPPWLVEKGVADLRAQHFAVFVPIFKLPSEYALWPTKEEREAGQKLFHWKTLDLNESRVRDGLWAPKGSWKGTGSPPVTEHLNVLGMCLDLKGEPKTPPIVASFSRTSFKAGQRLVTQCQTQKMSRLPFWGRLYYLFTGNPIKNNKGTFYVINIAKGRKLLEAIPDEEIAKEVYKSCFSLAKQLADEEHGKALQESMINAAQFVVDDDAESVDEDAFGETTEKPF